MLHTLPPHSTRRTFLRSATLLSSAAVASHLAPSLRAAERQVIFDGKTLKGWFAAARLHLPQAPAFAQMGGAELTSAVRAWHEARAESQALRQHFGRWEVVDDAIVGGQQPVDSNLGAYLLSERKFADFELELDARPDWPADTGIMVRASELGCVGFQVLVDHRPKGGIGGIFGNSIGGFLAAPFTLDGDKEPGFRVKNLREGAREGQFKPLPMNHAATFAEFAKVWRANEWNHFRIRCVGRLPVITTWVNGLKICEFDSAKIEVPGYDPELVFKKIGRAGHIGFEVHDVNLKNPLGQDRWAHGAVCRWRNITVQEL